VTSGLSQPPARRSLEIGIGALLLGAVQIGFFAWNLAGANDLSRRPAFETAWSDAYLTAIWVLWLVPQSRTALLPWFSNPIGNGISGVRIIVLCTGALLCVTLASAAQRYVSHASIDAGTYFVQRALFLTTYFGAVLAMRFSHGAPLRMTVGLRSYLVLGLAGLWATSALGAWRTGNAQAFELTVALGTIAVGLGIAAIPVYRRPQHDCAADTTGTP